VSTGASPQFSGYGLGPPLDITQYTLTFSDEFTSLSVSCSSPKSPSTWYCHKPDGQDFGNIGFNNFSVSGGILTIPLVLVGGTWEGGILSSIDASGAGFSQLYGYWEARMFVSPQLGSNNPTFWLLAADHIPNNGAGTCTDVEIDVLEQLGNFKPYQLNSTYHNWSFPATASGHVTGTTMTIDSVSDGGFSLGQIVSGTGITSGSYIVSFGTATCVSGTAQTGTYTLSASSSATGTISITGAGPSGQAFAVYAGEMNTGYHLYGVDVEPDYITYYYDRYPIVRQVTPPEAKTPMFVLVDQACDNVPTCPGTTSPSNLLVDYVRAYQHN